MKPSDFKVQCFTFDLIYDFHFANIFNILAINLTVNVFVDTRVKLILSIEWLSDTYKYIWVPSGKTWKVYDQFFQSWKIYGRIGTLYISLYISMSTALSTISTLIVYCSDQ